MRCITCVLLCLVFAGSVRAADDTEIRDALKAVLANKPRIPGTLDIFGKPTHVEVSGVCEAGLKILVTGTELDLAWKEVVPAQFAALLSEAVTKPEQKLALLKYCVDHQLTERASKISLEILHDDPTLQTKVAELLKTQAAPEKPAPVAPPANVASPDPAPKPAEPNAAAKAAAAAGIPLGSTPNHPRLPPIKGAVLWNTPEADAILKCVQIFPPDNAWNEDISKRPVHPNSDKIVKNVGENKPLHIDVSENFVIVGPDVKKVDVKITTYAKLADPGPYPMPDNAPVQGWGLNKKEPLEPFQRVGEGDRHILVLDPYANKLYEFYSCHKTDAGWTAMGEATFDLTSNKTRPKNWASADASGMAMLPGIIKYHELEQGVINHAIRLTVSKTRKAYIYPATHPYAGHTDDPTFPAMGERFRLKANVDLSKLPKQALVIAIALKKYGAIVADNGADWDLCATPDSRIDYDQMRAINKLLKGSDMEVVLTTGEFEPPRPPKQ